MSEGQVKERRLITLEKNIVKEEKRLLFLNNWLAIKNVITEDNIFDLEKNYPMIVRPEDESERSIISEHSIPFWYNSINYTRPHYNTVVTSKILNDDLRKISTEELQDYKEKIFNESDEVHRQQRNNGLYFLNNQGTIFYDAINLISKELDSRTCSYYNIQGLDIITTEDQKVNGYSLYNSTNFYSNYDIYIQHKKIVLNDTVYTKEEYLELLDETCCSEWSKQNRHGEYYEGFWKYPEGSYEKENAWTLSRNDNFEAIWELPYSRDLIIISINTDCDNFQESVRYSNFYCYALELKEKQLDKYVKDVINILSKKMAKDCAILAFGFLGSHKN